MNSVRAFLPRSLGGIRQPKQLESLARRQVDDRPRILADVSVIIRNDAQTGIQRVVRAVWINLLEQSGTDYEIVPIYASRTHGYRYARPDFLALPAAQRLLGKPVQVQDGDHFLGLDLSAHLLPLHRRQLERWRSRGMQVNLVVYDLLPLWRPEWFTEKAVKRFNAWLEVLRDNCDQALCISDHVARDLRKYLAPAASRPAIGRLKLAGDIAGSCPSRGVDTATEVAIQYASRRPAVLMVGTIEPRKGHDVALAAFEYLWERNGESAPALIIVGKPGWRTDAIQKRLQTHPEAGRRLYWLTNVSDEGLSQLYKSSAGLLLASHAEGFGLPAIEAAMHGKHALVRDLPVFREQQLSNLIYFTDDRPGPLAQMIVELSGKAGTVPAQDRLPSWTECVHCLLGEMGLTTGFDCHANSRLRQAS